MDTVIITGSSGFLGRALSERLKQRYRVVGLDIAAPDDAPVETIAADLTSDESVHEALAQAMAGASGALASVVHLAAYYDLTGEDNPKYEQITIEGTRRLVEVLRPYAPEQIVFTSTMLVHAPSEPGKPINEDSAVEGSWAYPQSKVEAESVLVENAKDTPTVVLRPAGIYSEDCRSAFLAQQIARIYERLVISRFYSGDASTGQPHLHVEDFVDAVARAIDRRAKLPKRATYLLGEMQAPSYEVLQDRIGCLIHGDEWDTIEVPKPIAKMGAWVQEEVLDQDPFIKPWMIDISEHHYELDIRRARRELGWFPHHSLIDSLPKMIARLKADPPRWYDINKLDASRVAARGGALARAAQHAETVEHDRAATRALETKLSQDRERTRWTHLVNIALGAWLVLSPWSYGLFDPAGTTHPPAAGHDLASPETRNSWLAYSEIVSGLIVMALSALALQPRRGWAQWGVAAAGVWVMSAPLVFWTTSAAAYNMDTLIGTFVAIFAVMAPPAPGISRAALSSDADLPLGWTYSPSSFVQRVPIVALAFVGLFVSRYLASYQLGHIDSVWDPFFGGRGELNGSESVVTSRVSRAFPIPDAGLGVLAYLLDIITGAAGGRARWRTMPWLVLLFGFLIIPLGAVSVGFIIIQPLLIGTLCSLCLLQAVVTLLLIPYAIDEVLACGQYLWQSKRAGRSLWQTLWTGGPPLQPSRDETRGLNQPFLQIVREFMSGGVNFPWTLTTAVLAGIALMASPLILGAEGQLYLSNHIVGCIVIAIAVTAMAEVARLMRFAILPCGAWVIVSPLVYGAELWVTTVHIGVGIALVLLSLPMGTRSEERYGAWDRFIA